MIVLSLPQPPSVNALYFNRRIKGKRGRGKTSKYRDWLKEADRWFFMQKHQIKPQRGKLEIQIKLPIIRGDLDNRMKSILDYLVSREITGDDRHNWKVSVEIVPTLACCEITIIPKTGLDTIPELG